MPTLTVIQNGKEKKIPFEKPTLLSQLLEMNGTYVDMDCGGRGMCKKCSVMINGKSTLACRHTVKADEVVVLPDKAEILSVTGVEDTLLVKGNVCLCLDIGTTTLALSLVCEKTGNVVKTVTAQNEQRSFGADVMSRIDYCSKNSPSLLHKTLLCQISRMTQELLTTYGISCAEKMYVAANTTMLHLFFGCDCTPLGTSPYTPQFLGMREAEGEKLGLDKVKTVVTLPGISAFAGADIVSGLYYLAEPEDKEKYNILVDLGTNAEIVLWNENKYLCSSAAAGPCFEGANITCGMSACEGAVCSYFADGKYELVCGSKAKGICATGLVDVICFLLKRGIVDKSGYMQEEEFYISDDVFVSQEDVRSFQLAKSAVRSALECLMERQKIGYESIERLYIAGGFSSQLNITNSAFVGLVPTELCEKFVPVNNSCLKGLVKYAREKGNLSLITQKAEYVDMGTQKEFSQRFVENMSFTDA